MTGTPEPPLAGRVALVTGASGGIGAALARHLATAGMDLALAYGRHRDQAERAAAEVRSRGRRAALLGADLADHQAPRWSPVRECCPAVRTAHRRCPFRLAGSANPMRSRTSPRRCYETGT